MKPFVFHPEARAELVAAAVHYQEINPALAQRFFREIDEVTTEICARPKLRRMFDPPARRHFGSTFPYAIVYIEEPDRIWIVAVMHFKRRPGYWHSRLR